MSYDTFTRLSLGPVDMHKAINYETVTWPYSRQGQSFRKRWESHDFLRSFTPGGGGGALPYMAYTGTCRWTGYGFWPRLS